MDSNNNNFIGIDEKLETLELKCKSQDMEIHLLKCGLADAMQRIATFEESFKETKKTSVTKKIVKNATSPNLDKTQSRITSLGDKYATNRNSEKIQNESPKAVIEKPQKVVKKRTAAKRSQSVMLTKADKIENEYNGRNKLILAKKPSNSRKRLSSNLSFDSSGGKMQNGDASPKDDQIKFNLRGRGLTFYKPSEFSEGKDSGSAPEEKLRLQWVYGYRGKDSRDNILLLASGELAYNMAGVIILFNRKTYTQRHYVEHTDNVKCIAVHPNGKYIASGQVAGHGDGAKPHVRVWDSGELNTLSIFGEGMFERAVTCVEFLHMEGGTYLVALDETNVVYIYDWEKAILIAEAKGSKDPIFGVKCSVVSELSFVTYGKSHLAFWKMEFNEKRAKFGLVKKMGIYDKVDKPKYALCIDFTEIGDVITGDSNGNILIYEKDSNRSSLSALSAHKGGVVSILYVHENQEFISCGKDGQFSSWNKRLEKTKDFGNLDDQFGFVRDLIWCREDQSYLIGTNKNCMLSFDEHLSTNELITYGHSDEMWGLATHPSTPLFATCSQEQLVCIWNGELQKNVWAYYIDDPARSAEFHPTEQYVIIGTRNGRLYFLNYHTKDEIMILNVSQDCIDDIKISPDRSYMAVSCRDSNIYLYVLHDELNGEVIFKKPKILQGHSSRVLHLDWSNDSSFIQSNSADYEILYWQAESGLQVLSAAFLRDVEWYTWTCPFGYPAMGIWPEGADGTDVNACARSNNKTLIATGDDFSEVKIFRYPCVKLKADCQVGSGHSSHVTCVRFLHNDVDLVTVGGQDCSVMQWRVIKEATI